jgi:glucose-6-phosphate 1-dehydrogenase
MIERLATFGATGDLTARYLLPGLAALQAAGQLCDRFQLASAGRAKWDTGDFRRWAAAQLDRHGGQFPAAARQAVVSAASYHQADVADVPSVAHVIAGDGPVAAYSPSRRPFSRSRSPLCTMRACRRAAGSSWRSPSARTWTAPSS